MKKERSIDASDQTINDILFARKTQFRKRINPQPQNIDDLDSGTVCGAWQSGFVDVKCPYGDIGDRLWIREDFIFFDINQKTNKCRIKYNCGTIESRKFYVDKNLKNKKVPYIHMPRWASRITLEITDIRVERLQDISDQDALAEGCTGKNMPPDDLHNCSPYSEFMSRCQSINGEDSWQENPWVWVIEFKRIDGGKE